MVLPTTAAVTAAAAPVPASSSSASSACAAFAVVAPLSSELLLLAEILSAWRGYPSPLFARDEHSGHVRFTPRVSLAHLSDGAVERLVADFSSWINLKADVQKFMRAFGGHQATHGRCLQVRRGTARRGAARRRWWRQAAHLTDATIRRTLTLTLTHFSFALT